MDKIDKDRRSSNMRSIRSSNTQPELIVRKFLFSSGYRYRLNSPKLPGKPDLIFNKKKKVIFIHGCFWHQHSCKGIRSPKSNIEYWGPKLIRNVERDIENQAALVELGWRYLILWECEIKDFDMQKKRLISFLEE